MVEKKTPRKNEADSPESPRELVENLRELIDEAESMIIRTASHQMDETVEELRERLQEKIDRMKAAYQQTEERVVDQVTAADKAIREKPYQSLGIAAAVGLAVGLFINRKR